MQVLLPVFVICDRTPLNMFRPTWYGHHFSDDFLRLIYLYHLKVVVGNKKWLLFQWNLFSSNHGCWLQGGIWRWDICIYAVNYYCKPTANLPGIFWLQHQKSTLVQVMAWCRQVTIHYLSQRWLSPLSPYGIAKPQWVKWLHVKTNKSVSELLDSSPFSSNKTLTKQFLLKKSTVHKTPCISI